MTVFTNSDFCNLKIKVFFGKKEFHSCRLGLTCFCYPFQGHHFRSFVPMYTIQKCCALEHSHCAYIKITQFVCLETLSCDIRKISLICFCIKSFFFTYIFQPLQVTQGAEKFLTEKGGKVLANVQVAKKKRNTLSKVVGGQAITETVVFDKIKEHNDKYGNKSKGKKSKSKQKQQPIPSTSGLQTVKKRKIMPVPEESSDEEIQESEKCIVCKRISPDFSSRPHVIIVNGESVKNAWDGFILAFVPLSGL